MKIVIDPGHGGKDPGAVGNGLREKDIVLTISKRIRDILLQEYEGVEAIMTRDDDTFLDLSERAKIANAWRADYFMSIHVNAGGGSGFESYVHSSPSAASVAARNVIHTEIMNSLPGIIDRGRKNANFVVLRQTNMPAILTEILFIDNPTDAARLRDPAFLEVVARGHVNGLERAFGLNRGAREERRMMNPEDANKIIRFLSAGWYIAQTTADKAEFNRLANELRKASGQDTQ